MCANPEPLPYFRPGAIVTRGQLAKIVSNAAGYSEAQSGQIFEDVPPDNPYYLWIMRLASRGIVGGYPCGGSETEPCIGPLNRSYFRPYEGASRAHVAKIISLAKGYNQDPGSQVYQDVPTTDPYYIAINRLWQNGVMSGYSCGGLPSEPCVAPDNRPYFRPYYYATRGQVAKATYNAWTGCPALGPGLPGVTGTATVPLYPSPTTQTTITPYIPTPVQTIPLPVPSVPVPIPTGPASPQPTQPTTPVPTSVTPITTITTAIPAPSP